jgi:hypothetical protein
MWKAALYDKEIASTLAESFKIGDITKENLKRLSSRYFAVGLPLLEEEQEQAQ